MIVSRCYYHWWNKKNSLCYRKSSSAYGVNVYTCLSLYHYFTNFSFVDDAFGMIFSQAFNPQAGLGGLLGVLITGFRTSCIFQ